MSSDTRRSLRNWWLSGQLNPAVLIAFNAAGVDVGWLTKPKQVVRDRLTQMVDLADWIDAHGRLPKQHVDDQLEAHQARALMKLAFACRAGALTADEIELADRRYPPGWAELRVRTDRIAIMTDLADWIDAHGRLPKKNADDRVERTQAQALMRLARICRSCSLTAAENKLADRRYPSGWAEIRRRNDRIVIMTDLADWIDAHGRLPKQKSDDPMERTQAQALNYLARAYRAGATTQEQNELAECRFPVGWGEKRALGRPPKQVSP